MFVSSSLPSSSLNPAAKARQASADEYDLPPELLAELGLGGMNSDPWQQGSPMQTAYASSAASPITPVPVPSATATQSPYTSDYLQTYLPQSQWGPLPEPTYSQPAPAAVAPNITYNIIGSFNTTTEAPKKKDDSLEKLLLVALVGLVAYSSTKPAPHGASPPPIDMTSLLPLLSQQAEDESDYGSATSYSQATPASTYSPTTSYSQPTPTRSYAPSPAPQAYPPQPILYYPGSTPKASDYWPGAGYAMTAQPPMTQGYPSGYASSMSGMGGYSGYNPAYAMAAQPPMTQGYPSGYAVGVNSQPAYGYTAGYAATAQPPMTQGIGYGTVLPSTTGYVPPKTTASSTSAAPATVDSYIQPKASEPKTSQGGISDEELKRQVTMSAIF